MTRPDWQTHALCAQTDPAAFYPDVRATAAPAKQVCSACPVTNQCLEHALTHNERWGVWGGLTERERDRLTRRRTPNPARKAS